MAGANPNWSATSLQNNRASRPPGSRRKSYASAANGDEKIENVESAHVTKTGATVPVLLSLSLLTDDEGESMGIASITKDLSNIRHTEEMLRAQTQELGRSNKDLEEFAYVAAHDLREPLIGVAAHIKLLERHLKLELDVQAQKFISRAFTTISRMDRLIQSLLLYSRLAGEVEHLQPTDCNVALEEALSGLMSAMEERGAKVEGDPLPTVMANASLLVQVFQNLLSNAIRFAGDEPLKIRIGAQREEREWRFFVRDNGIGIEPPHFDRIFRIFQQIDASPDRPGTGIGLAGCKKIVEHHGGRIWVESKPGRGSTFFFTIPHRTGSDS